MMSKNVFSFPFLQNINIAGNRNRLVSSVGGSAIKPNPQEPPPVMIILIDSGRKNKFAKIITIATIVLAVFTIF